MVELFAAKDPIYAAIYKGTKMSDPTSQDYKELRSLTNQVVFEDLDDSEREFLGISPAKGKVELISSPKRKFRARSCIDTPVKSPERPTSPPKTAYLTPETYKKQFALSKRDISGRKLSTSLNAENYQKE